MISINQFLSATLLPSSADVHDDLVAIILQMCTNISNGNHENNIVRKLQIIFLTSQ